MFFRVDWESDQEIDVFLDDYTNNCVAMNGAIDIRDGLCQVGVVVENIQLFVNDADVMSIDNVLAKASIGAFEPMGITGEEISGIEDSIMKYPSGPLTKDTVFEFIDSFGRTQWRKNAVSMVNIGSANSALKMRNPVGFFSVAEFTERDARYELDAALEQYFYHPNTAPFLGTRLAQRFGISNPSPRYVETISMAFHTGKYQGIGSGKYGCLKATLAAVLLDPESLDANLDSDPAQ
jgi:cullin-associated NEDD8-dissociated protein 1